MYMDTTKVLIQTLKRPSSFEKILNKNGTEINLCHL